MADIGTLNPEQMLQQQQILRQQKMAEMLMQQGMQQPQAQMVGGRYVAPSIFQNLASLANQYVGQKGIEKAQQAQIDLAKAIRGQETTALADYMSQLQGKPAGPDRVTEMAGPYGISGAGQNVPMPTATMAGTPAVAGNPTLANMNALQNPNSPAFLRQLAIKKITEGPEGFTLTEGATRVERQPDGSLKVVASGGQKPRAPLQIDTGTAIELRDPANPTVVLQRIPKSQMPTAGQVSEDGTFLIDTRTGRTTPIIGAGGQQITGGGKPLTESQGKASAFQSQMVSASNAVNTLESQGFDPTSFKSQTAVKLAGGAANPVIPVAAQQYKQAQDQWSEAYLRFKTGAAATEPEVVRNNRTFFPVFGDKPEQIAQKAVAREQAERDIGIAAGRGSMLGAQPIGPQPKQIPTKPAGLPSQSAIEAELKRRGL